MRVCYRCSWRAAVLQLLRLCALQQPGARQQLRSTQHCVVAARLRLRRHVRSRLQLQL